MSAMDNAKGVFFSQKPGSYSGIDLSGARLEESLSLASIDPWPGNRLLSDAAVERLADDVEKVGQLQPVLVRPRPYGRYQLLAGHHRVAAFRLLAERHPEEIRWKGVQAIVKDFDDGDAEHAVLSSNVYMIPEWEAEERGALWMGFSEQAREMRKADPERYGGMRIDEIVVEVAEREGIKTSRTSVIRDKAAYRKAVGLGEGAPEGLCGEWEGALADGAVTMAQAKALARLDEGEQESLWDSFCEKRGYGKRWIAAVLSARDPRDRGKAVAKAEKELKRVVEDLDVACAAFGADDLRCDLGIFDLLADRLRALAAE